VFILPVVVGAELRKTAIHIQAALAAMAVVALVKSVRQLMVMLVLPIVVVVVVAAVLITTVVVQVGLAVMEAQALSSSK
jgi:hypothetical protein